jgi:hypothetical protein
MLLSFIMNPDIVKVIKVGKLRCPGHLFRMQEENPCRELTLCKPESTRRVGTPAIRWLDSVQEYFKTMGLRNWRRTSQHRDQWRAIVKKRPRFIKDCSTLRGSIRRRGRKGRKRNAFTSCTIFTSLNLL